MVKIIVNVTFLLLLFTSHSYAEHRSTLAVGWELWYPYQYHNKQNELVGLDIEIFNKITETANYEINITELPWKRHLQYVKTGKMDVAMGASFSKEREEYAYFTNPYRKELVKLYVKKGTLKSIKLNVLSDLMKTDYMIGVESGYFYGNDYQELIKKPSFQSRISEVIDLEQNIKLTLKGHLDGFLVDPVTMKAFVEKYKLENEFEEHSLPIYQDDIFIMLSKKTMDETDLKRFNSAIDTLRKQGELTKITERWTNIQRLKR